MPVPLLIIPAVAAAASSGLSAGVIAGAIFGSVGTTVLAIKAYFTFSPKKPRNGAGSLHSPEGVSQSEQENLLLDRMDAVHTNVALIPRDLKTVQGSMASCEESNIQVSVGLKETNVGLKEVNETAGKSTQFVQIATDSLLSTGHLLKDFREGLSNQTQKIVVGSVSLMERLGVNEGMLGDTQATIKTLTSALDLKTRENSELESRVKTLSLEKKKLIGEKDLRIEERSSLIGGYWNTSEKNRINLIR